MDTKMILREYCPSDCGELVKLFYDTVHTVNAKDYTKEQLDVWATGKEDLQKWNQSLQEHYSIVAVADGILTGFGDIDKTGYLDRLYVHKDYQKKGIATAICDKLEGRVQGRIETHASVTAKPFFEKRGYTAIKRQQVERQGICLVNYVMEKRVKKTSKKSLLFTGIGKLFLGVALMGAMLFLPAGTWNFPGAWRLLGFLFVPMLLSGAVLFWKAPELLKKRMNSREKEQEQKKVILLSSLIFAAGFVLAGVDYRLGISQLSFPVVIAGVVMLLAGYGLYIEVMRENAYLSRTVEIQENQKVIDNGLYGVVRHPMYLAVILLFTAMPLVLGSFLAVLPFLGFPAVLVKRIKNEEKVLEEGLCGYREYQKKVRYRLLPFVW